jgi:hypothetical protein
MSGSHDDEIYFGGPEWKIQPISASPEDELYEEIFEFWEKLVVHSFMLNFRPMTQLEEVLDKYPEAQINMVNFRPMTQLEEVLDKYPEAQTNGENEIAVKYRQPGNVLLQENPSGKEYVAVTQANICMAWVDPADVDFVLAKKDGCCGKKQQSFHLANESDVRRWTNKGGQ